MLMAKNWLSAFAKELGSQMIYFVPRDNMVQRAEINKKTVLEFDDTAVQAQEYRNLAAAVDSNQMFVVPTPIPGSFGRAVDGTWLNGYLVKFNLDLNHE